MSMKLSSLEKDVEKVIDLYDAALAKIVSDEEDTSEVCLSDDELPQASKDDKYYPDFAQKLLVRVQYPGNVQNVDKMLDTLGGKDSLEIAVGGAHKRLNLRFRPEDRYSKSVTGDKNENPGILLKVKYRVPKINIDQPGTSADTEPKTSIVDYDVIGLSVMNFTFNRMCDFQYLPLVSKTDNEESKTKLSCIYKDILPDKLPDANEWLTNEEAKNMMYFFPPSSFSRFDVPQDLLEINKFETIDPTVRPELARMFQKRKEQKAAKMKENNSNVIIRSRQLRKGHSIFVNFENPTIPTKPSDIALNDFKSRSFNSESLDKLKQLFKDRPIWSKAALQYLTGIAVEQIKTLLPLVAYYFQTGPWRVMWVRYGYDPRKTPGARIYQTFDFRIRSIAGLKLKVQAKRSYSSKTAQYRLGSNVKKYSLKIDLDKKSPRHTVISESSYILRPGVIPPARQMFYQYCDIYIPEIQAMISRLPDVAPNKTCDSKNGWLPNNFNDQCREIASKYIRDEVQKEILLDKLKKQQKESSAGDDENISNDPDLNIADCVIVDSNDDDDDNARESFDAENSSDDDKRESDDSESDGDIDMEAVEEINKFIEQTKLS